MEWCYQEVQRKVQHQWMPGVVPPWYVGVEDWEGKESDAVDSALAKIWLVKIVSCGGISIGIVFSIGMEKLIDASSGSLDLVFALSKLTGDAGDEFDDKTPHKFVIGEERAGVKLVNFFTTEDTGVERVWFGGGDLVDKKIGIGGKIDRRIKWVIRGSIK